LETESETGLPLMRRRTLAGVAALTLFDIVAAQAQAQTPPPPINWTGTYIGGTVGYRAADADINASYAGLPQFPADYFTNFNGLAFPFAAFATTVHPSGAVGGVHLGYNDARLFPNWLVGVETDFVFGKSTRSASLSFSDPANGQSGSADFSATLNWSTSFRGKLGYIHGSWLFYGTGGLSLAEFKLSGNGGYRGAGSFGCGDGLDSLGICDFSTASGWGFSSTKILPGFVLGGGIEYLHLNRWMFRVEYLYADYGRVGFANYALNGSYSDNFDCGGNGCPQAVYASASAIGNASVHLTTQTIRFGVSYRLDP
jgi:outer membrane immunogenic protein